jgi:hypothetical protein
MFSSASSNAYGGGPRSTRSLHALHAFTFNAATNDGVVASPSDDAFAADYDASTDAANDHAVVEGAVNALVGSTITQWAGSRRHQVAKAGATQA